MNKLSAEGQFFQNTNDGAFAKTSGMLLWKIIGYPNGT